MSWNEKFTGPAPSRKPQEPYGPYLPQQKQPPEPLVLITQAGDDFYKLARDYFLEPRQLRRVNLHLCDPQDLKGGEALVIPLAEADMREMQSFLLRHTINNAEPRRRFGRLVPASVDVPDPERAAQVEWSNKIAGWYWKELRRVNAKADLLETSKDERAAFVSVTTAINGGTNGLADRIEYYKRAKKALGITWGTLR